MVRSEIHINPQPALAELIQQAVETGEYASQGEVIGEALLECRLRRELNPTERDALCRLWDEGVSSDPGDSGSMEEIRQEARRRGPKNRLATKPRTDLPIVVRSRQADDDLPEIWRYIAQGNAHAADGVLARIERALDPADPQSSDRTRTPGLRQDLRFLV